MLNYNKSTLIFYGILFLSKYYYYYFLFRNLSIALISRYHLKINFKRAQFNSFLIQLLNLKNFNLSNDLDLTN